MLGQSEEGGGREWERCVLGFSGSWWLASVFSHAKSKIMKDSKNN